MIAAESFHLLFLLFLAETWKPLPGWPAYEVSNWGRLKSHWGRASGHGRKRVIVVGEGQLLKPTLAPKTGHWHYWVGDGNGNHATFAPAVLILMAFDRAPSPGEVARHVYDPTPSNNFRWNLAWGTLSDNTIDKVLHGNHPMTPLNPEIIREIRRSISAGVPQKDLAVKYGVSRGTITHIKKKQTWAHVRD